MERILKELTTLIIGWFGYYSIADMKKYLTKLTEWLKREQDTVDTADVADQRSEETLETSTDAI
jgi:hypothetical protein